MGAIGLREKKSFRFSCLNAVWEVEIGTAKFTCYSDPVNLKCRQILPGRCPAFEPRGGSLLRDRDKSGTFADSTAQAGLFVSQYPLISGRSEFKV